MKNGKRLKRAQKQLLTQRNLNAENWLCERSLPGEMRLVHRHTGRVRVVSC